MVVIKGCSNKAMKNAAPPSPLLFKEKGESFIELTVKQ